MFIYVILLSFSCLQKSAKMIPITKVDHFWINPCGLDKEPLNKDCGINTILNKAIINKTLQYCLLDAHKALEDAKNLQIYLVSLGYFNLKKLSDEIHNSNIFMIQAYPNFLRTIS